MFDRGKVLVMFAGIAWLCMHHGAVAAKVSRESGMVFVNTGSGYQVLEEDTELPPGGKVMVRPGGIAVITYSSSCVVRAGPGRVWIVAAEPPCSLPDAAIADRIAWEVKPKPATDIVPPTATVSPAAPDAQSDQVNSGLLFLGVAAAAEAELTFGLRHRTYERPASP